MKAVTTVELSKWVEIPLGKLVSFEKGRVVTTQPYETTGALPYIGAENFGGALTLYTTDPTAVLCEPTDVVMLWDGERSGLCSKGLRGAIGSTVVRLRPRNTVNVGYLYHQLARFFPWIQARRTGTGVPHVPKDLSSILWLPVPNDAKEQCRIAKALDTVDEAIANTEAVVAKLRQARAGLLHDLLTRGLDENGELRDPVSHPEQFQETFAGPIPLEWEVKTLVTLCRHIGSGVTPRGGESVYTDVGVMFIRSQNVTFDVLVLDDVAFIPEGIHQAMLRSEVFAHDVLFNITGASIGRCCVMPASLGRANVNQHVCILRLPDATAPSAAFLSSVLASPIGQKQLEALNTFGNRQGINYQQLGSFVIPWPKENERARIAQQIWAMDLPLNEEQRYLTKLRVLKSGLMSDLLTGRVRVPKNLGLPK